MKTQEETTEPYRPSKTLAFCSGVSVERLADTSLRTASLLGLVSGLPSFECVGDDVVMEVE